MGPFQFQYQGRFHCPFTTPSPPVVVLPDKYYQPLSQPHPWPAQSCCDYTLQFGVLAMVVPPVVVPPVSSYYQPLSLPPDPPPNPAYVPLWTGPPPVVPVVIVPPVSGYYQPLALPPVFQHVPAIYTPIWTGPPPVVPAVVVPLVTTYYAPLSLPPPVILPPILPLVHGYALLPPTMEVCDGSIEVTSEQFSLEGVATVYSLVVIC